MSVDKIRRLERQLSRLGYRRRKKKPGPAPKTTFEVILDNGQPVQVEYDTGTHDGWAFHSPAISPTGYHSYYSNPIQKGASLEDVKAKAREIANMLAYEYRAEWEKETMVLSLPDYMRNLGPGLFARTYRLYHRRLKKFSEDIEAENPLAACTKAGWKITDCWVREYTYKGGWRDITPRQGIHYVFGHMIDG